MKTRLLTSLLSLLAGLAAAWVVPQTARRAPAAATAPAQPAPRPLPLVKSGDAATTTRRGEAFARLFSGEGWEDAAKEWAEEDPAGFCDWLVGRGIPPGEPVLLILFQAWVKRDVAAALTALANLPADYRSADRRTTELTAYKLRPLRQPGGLEASLPWLSEFSRERDGFDGGWTERPWMTSRPPQELAAFLATHYQRSLGAYEGLVEQFAWWWTTQDAAAAGAWVRSLDPLLRKDAMTGYAKALSEHDHIAALEWIATEAPPGYQDMAYGVLEWIDGDDLPAGAAWELEHLNGATAGGADNVYGQWCHADAGAALKFALAIPDPDLHTSYLGYWASEQGNEAVAAILPTVTAPADREALLDGMGKGGFGSSRGMDPATDPAAFKRVSTTLAAECGEIARRDAPRAFGLAANLPENYRPAALAAVLAQWPGPEAVEAVERLHDSPAGEAGRAFLKAQGR